MKQMKNKIIYQEMGEEEEEEKNVLF